MTFFRNTDAKQAIDYLKSHNIRMLIDNPNLIEFITGFTNGLLLSNYEESFLTDGERRILGERLDFIGATKGGLLNSNAVADVFLNDPVFGLRKQNRALR